MTIVEKVAAWLADPAHWQGDGGIPVRLLEHVGLSIAALAIAAIVALPIGLWIGHTRRGATFAINLANLGRAIPSLAAITIIVPFTQAIDPSLGFSLYPIVFGMVILAIPPILVNAYAGIAEVDPDLVEAGRGMGLRERQVLTSLEVPVALPVILAGIRSATVQVVATLTLGAIYGGGGLGRFIVDGVAVQDDGQLFGGVVLVAALAILSEGSLALLQRRVTRARAAAPGGPASGPAPSPSAGATAAA